MGDVTGQVGAEEDVHRPADAHLAFEREARVFGDEGVSAVRADEVFRADRQVLARQTVAAGGGHALGILDVAEVFGGHARLRATRAGGLEEDRLHEGLRQVVHLAWGSAQVAGLGLGAGAPGLHPAQLLTSKRHAEDVVAHQVLPGGVHHRFGFHLGAKVAQDLHRALVGDVGAGAVGEPAVAVHHQNLDAGGGQECGGGGPGGAGADDQDVGGDVSHCRLL